MGNLGLAEIFILLIFFAVPWVVLLEVAKARGQSPAYSLWGLLGWFGLVIGLLIMIAMPRRSGRTS